LLGKEPPEPILEIDEKMPICASRDLVNSAGTLMYDGKIITKCEQCPHASRYLTTDKHGREDLVLRKFKVLQPELTEAQAKFIGKKRQDDFFKWYWGDGSERYPGVRNLKLSPTCDTNFTFVVGTEKAEQLTLVVYKRTTEKTGIDLLRALDEVPVPWAYRMVLVVKDWTHEKYRGFQYPHLEIVEYDENWEQHPNKDRFNNISINIDDYLPNFFGDSGEADTGEVEKFGLPPELADMEGFEPPAAKPAPEPAPAPAPAKQEETVTPPPEEPPPAHTEPEPEPVSPPSEKVEDYDDLDMSELDGLSDL
jgi:hypothetical protein